MKRYLFTTLLILISGCGDVMGRPLVDTFQTGQLGREDCDYVTTCDIKPNPINPDLDDFDERPIACALVCNGESCPAAQSTALESADKLTCKSLSIHLTATATDLNNVDIENSALTIHAATRTELNLHSSNIRNSTLELSGPITLAFSDQSSMIRTKITAAQTSQGRPQLRVQDSRVSETHVLAGQDALDYSAIRALISLSMLQGRMVRIESSTIVQVELQSQTFEIVDANIERSLLGGDGSLSASNVVSSAIGSCDFLLIAGSALKQTQLTGCGQLLRLYNDSIDGGYLDGPIEADSTGISRSIIGLLAPTDLLGFNLVTNESAFCEQTARLRLGDGSMSCVNCAGPIEQEEPLACQAPGAKLSSRKMLCSALEAVPDCLDPFPASQRQPGR